MKKIWKYIKIAFYSFFYSMRSADKLLATSNKNDDLDITGVGGVEQQQEQDSVWQDLLKGEVTERVRELRHEMYYAERKSHEYEYAGGGNGRKNTIYSYKGKLDMSDGYSVKIVQANSVIPTCLTDAGVVVYGTNSDIYSENVDNIIRNRPNSEKEYRIKIDRVNYIPKFKIENYITKLVVKTVQDDVVMVDLYVNKYYNKLEPTSKLFHAEMERIYQGIDTNTNPGGILYFKRIHFSAKNAFGVPDLTEVSYVDFKFDNILEYDGHYVLKFFAKEEKQKDIIDEFYNEATAKKIENNEMREGATINLADVMATSEKDNYDAKGALDLINKVKK